jgi:hypothetical protein
LYGRGGGVCRAREGGGKGIGAAAAAGGAGDVEALDEDEVMARLQGGIASYQVGYLICSGVRLAFELSSSKHK